MNRKLESTGVFDRCGFYIPGIYAYGRCTESGKVCIKYYGK